MESKTISFFVNGKPVTQGSLTSFPYMKKGGAGMGVSTPQSAKVIEWRRKVQEGAQEAYPDLLDGITPLFPKGTPVYAYMAFKLLQPKSNTHLTYLSKSPVREFTGCSSLLDLG